MTVNSCPKCSGRVTLPEDASERAWVRCPICGAEYLLQRVLEHQPPQLEVIDEPAVPAEGRLPSWGAVAAASAVSVGALATREIAAPEGDGPADDGDILAMPPPSMNVEPISSLEFGDDADVITFDDSLLLDEPTETLPRVQVDGAEPAADDAPIEMTDADFFDSMTDEPQAGSEMQPAATDWEVDDMLEKNESSTGGGKPNAHTSGQPGDWANLEGSHATPTVAAGVIGMPPRRKGRGKNPIVMIGGIVVGGVLGLAIGYAILMWVFTKDPFSLASQLPDFLVPAALKPAGNARVAQFAAANGGTNDSGSNDIGTNNSDPNNGASPETGDTGKAGQPASNADQNPSGPFGNPFSTTETPTDSNTTGDINSDQSKKPGTETLQSLPEPTIDPFATKTDKGAAGQKEKSPPAGNLPDAATSKEDQKHPLDPFNESKSPDAKAAPANAKEALAKSSSSPDAKAAPTDPLLDPFGGAKENTEPVLPNPPDAVGPIANRSFSSQELMAAVEESHKTTETALTLPADADQKKKNAANGAYYMQLSKVAEALTFVDRTGDEKSQEKATNAAVTAFLDAVPDRQQLNEIGKLAGYWFKSESRPANGILLCGVVKESKQQGKLVESVVETLGKPALITVVSPSTLTDDPGRPVLVAGTIVKDPATNLRGYEGSVSTVVWAAMAIDPSSAAGGANSNAQKEAGAGKDRAATEEKSAAAPANAKE